MNEADGTTNITGDHATVGAQAGTIHGSVNVFFAPSDTSPEKKFEIGVNCLNSGITSRAREYIAEAVIAGYRTDKTVFYRVISLVSKRSPDDLTDEDADSLREECEKHRAGGVGEWVEALSTVCHILDAAESAEDPESAESAEESESAVEVALGELDNVSPALRGLIEQHTADFVRGPVRDGLWKRVVDLAWSEQRAGHREDRVWKFFEPKPAGPRVVLTEPVRIPVLTWVKAVLGAAVLAAATGYIGSVLVQFGRLPLLFVAMLSLTGGALGARDAMEWRFRVVRCRAKEQEHQVPRRGRASGRTGGFAQQVTERFDHYFERYVPDGTDRETWLANTRGIHCRLRDEIVELYREQRTDADAVVWLIRHLVGKVRDRFEKGTLYAYRTELATPVPTKVTAVLGLAALASGDLLTLAGAIAADPPRVAYTLFFLLLGGWAAIPATSEIVLEHRRSVADEQERAQEFAERSNAYARWTEKLKDRPTDREMAAWLECDQNLLMDEALHHHRLRMRYVLTYTFLEAPATRKRASECGGPLRYLRYKLLVFILTKDGVRQLSVHLDMGRGTFHNRKWLNYRYDAFAAVHVEQADNQRRTFKLSLVDGQKIEETVMPDADEVTEEASMVTLEAAGILHTLHILEGAAAEGKAWINHRYRRQRVQATSEK